MARLTFSEQTATEVVLGRLGADIEPRLRQVMTSIITHLHAVVREVEPSQEEWLTAIQFLTATGQRCDAVRQEFVLLSDTLGVSMLVDAINNRKAVGGTESTVLGPFYASGSPVRQLGDNIATLDGGEPCYLSGRVLDPDGTPLADVRLDVWQSNDEGFYNVQQLDSQPAGNLRGIFTSNEHGRYFFRSIVPSSYAVPNDGPVGKLLRAQGRHPWRPAHIHFIVSAPGYKTLTTHLFVAGDAYLDSDTVFGVKDSLIVDFKRIEDPVQAIQKGFTGPFREATYDFVLEPARVPAGAR